MLTFGLIAEAGVQSKTKLPTKKVTLKRMGASGARDTLQMLLDKTKLTYSLPNDLDNSQKLVIEANNVPWNEVFEQALQGAGYTYHFDDKGILRLTPTDAEPKARVPAKADTALPEPE